MSLFSVAKMQKGTATDVQDDHWSDEPLVRPEPELSALYEKIAECYDRPYEEMLKDKKHLR